MELKVSIIVPVFGVENYLDACVTSLVNQTYSNLEIFLVDDGSKDRCPEMCDIWAAKDHRIRVIHKENGGQGTARNVALDCSSGDYVLFVDSDDAIAENMVEKLISATNQGRIDSVLCGYSVNDGFRVANVPWFEQARTCSGKEIIYEYLTSGKITGGPVCKLIANRVMEKFRFPAFRANEDAYIVHEILGDCQKIAIITDHLYILNLREGSTERSEFNEHKMHMIDCAEALRSYIECKYPEFSELVMDKVAIDCLHLLKKLYREQKEIRYAKYEEKLKSILEKEYHLLKEGSKEYHLAKVYLDNKWRFRILIRSNYLLVKCKTALKRVIIRAATLIGMRWKSK